MHSVAGATEVVGEMKEMGVGKGKRSEAKRRAKAPLEFKTTYRGTGAITAPPALQNGLSLKSFVC